MPQTIELAPDYYLKNFNFMLEWVAERYSALLHDSEKRFIENFNQLPRDSQCLMVRMAGRRGVYFRRDKLQYREILCIDDAASHLQKVGIVHVNPEMDVQTLASMVTKQELFVMFEEDLRGNKSAKKQWMVDTLLQNHTLAQPWSVWTRGKLGDAYSLDVQEFIDLFILLFFGNAYQDLTEFVLQDLGLFTYENFKIDPEHQIFLTREELDEYRSLHHLAEAESQTNLIEDLISLSQQLPGSCVGVRNQNKLERIRNRIAYRLEQGGELDLALTLFELNSLAPSRERRIRILDKKGRLLDAWRLLMEVSVSPVNEHEAQVIARIQPRLFNKIRRQGLNDVVAGLQTPLANVSAGQSVYERKITIDAKYLDGGVEEATRLYYESLGFSTDDLFSTVELDPAIEQNKNTPCFYLENQLFNALFGLWLWPQIFVSVDGAFANPFQSAPLDLYQQDFVARRHGIKELWQLMDTEEYKAHILHYWRSKSGIANHFVNWGHLSEELLALGLDIIPATHLRAIFKRVLFDIKANKSGFPDLIQFNLIEQTYRLIEVKGPNDRLQDNQLRWIDYFLANDIPIEVCYVEWG